MATDQDNAERCCPNGEHTWPRSISWESCRCVGRVLLEECNCCLTVRVTQLNFYYPIKDPGKIDWKYVSKVTVIEPD